MTPEKDQYAKMMEKAIKNALKGVDAAAASVEKQRRALEKELDAAKEARKIAERQGEKIAQDYFEERRTQLIEFARTELLRGLVRKHLEAGGSLREIVHWLGVEPDFVKDIKAILKRNERYNMKKKPRAALKGYPKLRYSDEGRGGTIYFESEAGAFDMWWEFAGGDALAIIDVPAEQHWEARTKIPLEQREPVLQFIGEQVLEDKNGGRGSFAIGENVLTIYG